MIRDAAARHAGLLWRAGSLLAYVAVGLILPYAGSSALAVYNAACAIGDRFVDGRFFGADESSLDLRLYTIITIPTLLARSNLVIRANAAFALLSLVSTTLLIATAAHRQTSVSPWAVATRTTLLG
jgi:hypothetical protein